jgi:hypothetical protein
MEHIPLTNDIPTSVASNMSLSHISTSLERMISETEPYDSGHDDSSTGVTMMIAMLEFELVVSLLGR